MSSGPSRGALVEFAGADEGDVALSELAPDVAEGRRWIAVAHVMGVRARGEMHADPARAPHGDDSVGDLKQQSSAILDRAAVTVVTLVGVVLKELVEQVAVGAVDLDAVKAGRFGVLGASAIGLHDARKLLGLKRAGRDVSSLWANQAHMALRRNRAWANRKRAIMVDGIRDAPDMPELQKHSPARSMYARDNLAPALDLFVGPNAGGMRIADACGRDRSRLGNDKAGGRALDVIVPHHRVRNSPEPGRAVARQRRQEYAVGDLKIANLQGVEQGGH